ncbi:hypothetical protein ES703_87833 [subsurface metagenome]
MSRRQENTDFICNNCSREVLPLTNGSFRNHCPFCLFSRHVDIKPGDRKSECGGLMKPIGLKYKSGKGFQIVHRCLQCGEERVNKIAGGMVQPDDIEAIISL